MRTLKILLLAWLATTAASTPAAAAYIRIVGSAASSAVEPIPGLEDQGAYDLTAAGGQLVEGVVVDGGGRIGEPGYAGGQSVASATFGSLSALGGAVAVGPPPPFPAPGLGANGFTQAMWSDEVTLIPNDPALLYTPARFRFEVFLSGDGGVVRTTLGNQGFGNSEYSAAVEVGSCPVGCLFRRAGSWDATSPTGFFGDALPQALTGEVGVTFGSPFVLRVSMAANASVSVGGAGSVEAFSDLRNTVLWNGATVTNASGAPIAFQVQSTSGTDWSLPYAAPVPEPTNAMLILAGVAMVLFVVRRSDRRAERSTVALLIALGSLSAGVDAQTAMPLPVSSVGCYPNGTTNGAVRLDFLQGAASAQCAMNYVSPNGNEFYSTTARASTTYPGGGQGAAATSESTAAGQRVGTSDSVAEAILRYFLRPQEKLPPPFQPSQIPLVAKIEASFKTERASAQVAVKVIAADGNGGTVFFETSAPFSDERSFQVEVYPVATVNEIFGFEKQAYCRSGFSSSSPTSSTCSATVDPVVSLDQARFDAMWGEDSFALADYYELVYSPVPEPSVVLLGGVGLAVLTLTSKRGREAVARSCVARLVGGSLVSRRG